MSTKSFVLISAVLAFVWGFAPPAAAQIQECICDEVGGGPPGFPPHPNMRPATTYACAGGNLIATLVFNRQVANTVASRGSFPGLSSPNAVCGAHQGLRLAGVSPIGAVPLDANTVQLTYDGSVAAIQALITSAPASLTVSGTYSQQPHLVDQGEGLCIGTITGAGLLEKCQVEFSWDSKFCSNPNAFNCRRTTGVVPLTIFGNDELDVNEIDLNSLRLALANDPGMTTGALVSTKPLADRGSPGDVDVADDACFEDVANPDGLLDLDVGFSSGEVGSLIGCPLGRNVLSPALIVTGTLLDGTPLEALNEQVLRSNK